MIRRLSLMTLAVVSASACVFQTATSQTPTPAGQATKKNYTDADVHFMAGMIGHHAQAIQMAGWAPSHGATWFPSSSRG